MLALETLCEYWRPCLTSWMPFIGTRDIHLRSVVLLLPGLNALGHPYSEASCTSSKIRPGRALVYMCKCILNMLEYITSAAWGLR